LKIKKNTKMTSKEALKIVDDVVSQVNGTRQQHILIAEAIETLRVIVEKEENDK